MDDLNDYGPAMLALTEKQRRYVLAMAANPMGTQTDWARTAGYSDHLDRAKVSGCILAHNPKIEAAALEIAKGTLGAVGPLLATQVMLRAAANPKSKNHLRAAEMIANRVGLHEVQEVRLHKTDQTGAAMVARIKELAERHGIDPTALLGGNAPVHVKQIEAKVVEDGEIAAGTAGAAGDA